MNETKSSRYHQAQRRAAAASAALSAAVCAALLWTDGSSRLRDAVGGSAALYALVLTVGCGAMLLPVSWYRGYRLERQYELSRTSPSAWARDQAKITALVTALAMAAAGLVYQSMRWAPSWWWLIAAAAGTALAAVLTSIGPVLILPLFHQSRPLTRDGLRRRLVELSDLAGVPVLGVHEWSLGEATRRANAALVGAGATRRILVSDTLLDNYTDDEIEVVLAHEIGHHVHRDMLKGLVLEFVILTAAFGLASIALGSLARPLGLTSPADVAGLPLMLLVIGAVSLVATPVVNAVSRHNERRADRFALDLTARPDAFIGAMRRMSAHNLAEEHPSRAAFLMFHTHPTVDERIAAARRQRGAEAGPGTGDC